MTINENLLYSRIRERLKDRRRELGLTQAQLSRRANLQRTTVANIEIGQQNPPIHVFYQLCEAMEMEVATILPGIAEVAQPSTSINAVFDGTVSEINNTLPKTAGFIAQILERTVKGSQTG